jgi:hypothetical protein
MSLEAWIVAPAAAVAITSRANATSAAAESQSRRASTQPRAQTNAAATCDTTSPAQRGSIPMRANAPTTW